MAEEPSDVVDMGDEGSAERSEDSRSVSASDGIEPVGEQGERQPVDQGGGSPGSTDTVAAVGTDDDAPPPAVPNSDEHGSGPPSATTEPLSGSGSPTAVPTQVDARSAALDDLSTPELNGSEAPGGAPEVSEPEVAGQAEDVRGSAASGGQVVPNSQVVEPDPQVVALEALRRMERRMDEMARLGERNSDHAGSLHAENQRLRAGEIAMALAPLMRDVIRVHDDIVRLEGSCAAESTEDLALVRELLVGLLDRWGVRPFDPLHGDPFDVTEHNGIARVDTTEPLDGMVAGVRRCGFRSDEGRIMRPADVEVFRQISQPADLPIVEGE